MRRLIVTLLVPVLVLAACKDAPKPDATPKPTAPEAIPSDIVYNSFFSSPSATANLRVQFDGGLDAGGNAAVAEGPTGKAVVLDPGAEPKSKLSYAFAMGKTAVVTATVTASVGGGGPTAGDQPPFKFTFNVTPKTRAPDGKTHFDLKIQKVEIVMTGQVDPQMAQQKGVLEKAFTGLEGGFDATSNGDVENVSLAADKVPRMAQQILPLFAQSLEFLVIPVPSVPVGVGAKWTTTSRDEQIGATVTTAYTLVSHNGTAAEIKTDLTRAAPKKAFEDPQAPPGSMLEVKGSGSYVIDLRLDGVSSKADGSSTMTISLTAPGQPPQNTTVKQSQALESK